MRISRACEPELCPCFPRRAARPQPCCLGHEVVKLGIKVPPKELIEAYRELNECPIDALFSTFVKCHCHPLAALGHGGVVELRCGW